MEAQTITGVFAGYCVTPGYAWSGEYKVWALDDFANVDLHRKARIITRRFTEPHHTKRLESPSEGVVFPLKGEYDRRNYTLEGATERWLEENPDDGIPHQEERVKHMGIGDRWLRVSCRPVATSPH